MREPFFASLAGLFLFALALDDRHGGRPAPAAAEPSVSAGVVALHYAPAENLERVDVALLDGARQRIDMAAYVLTDYPVIEALTRAAGRGVAVRILLDRAEYARHMEHGGSQPFTALRAAPGVQIRVKTSRVLMHLKSYAVDGRWLRTGSANLSASGLKQQDNDLLVLDAPALAARFTADFEAAFAAGVSE